MRNILKLIQGSLLVVVLLLASVQAVSADQRDFAFVNNSPLIVRWLYVSPTAINEWGPDILGEGVVLNPGETLNITFFGDLSTCIYDLKAVDWDGNETVAFEFDLCTLEVINFTG